jgi:hypothetical protein
MALLPHPLNGWVEPVIEWREVEAKVEVEEVLALGAVIGVMGAQQSTIGMLDLLGCSTRVISHKSYISLFYLCLLVVISLHALTPHARRE